MRRNSFESIGAALKAPVPSARGQQVEQVVSRMNVVSEDALSPGGTANAGVIEGGERTTSYFLSGPVFISM